MAPGKNLVHALHEVGPVGFSVEIIHHEEATPLQILAHALGLGVGEAPSPDVDGIKEGPIERVVAIGIDDFFRGPGVQASETVDAVHELAVTLGVVLIPSACAVIHPEGSVGPVTANAGVMQAGEGELGVDVALLEIAVPAGAKILGL